jgi:F-type H+-transporting ATPase subunit b
MPQLDPTSYPSQLFWLTVSFVLLYIMLARFLLPCVQAVLASRARNIESDITAADRMKAEAEKARDIYEKALADARARAQALLTEAEAAVAEQITVQKAVLQKTVEKKLAEADAKIAAARQDALGKISPVCGDLAALIVEALIHQKPSAKEIGAAMDTVAKDRAA